MHKREATECDMDYAKKHNKDLNTALIFVRIRLSSLCRDFLDVIVSGRSVLCSQLCLRYRCPAQTAARSRRPVSRISSRYPPYSKPIRRPGQTGCPPSHLARSPARDNPCFQPPVRKSADLPVCCIRRDARETVAQPLPPTRGRFDDRALWGSSTKA